MPWICCCFINPTSDDPILYAHLCLWKRDFEGHWQRLMRMDLTSKVSSETREKKKSRMRERRLRERRRRLITARSCILQDMSAKVTDHDSRIEDRERAKGHEFTEKFDRKFWNRLDAMYWSIGIKVWFRSQNVYCYSPPPVSRWFTSFMPKLATLFHDRKVRLELYIKGGPMLMKFRSENGPEKPFPKWPFQSERIREH